MKKLMLGIAAAATAATLVGCVKMDKNPPKDLPAFVKLYPGSTHLMTMNMAGLTVDGSTTPDAPDKVLAFYRAEAASDGLSESQAPTAASAGQSQAAFTDNATGRMLIVVAKPQQGAGTMVDLSWKAPPAKAGS